MTPTQVPVLIASPQAASLRQALHKAFNARESAPPPMILAEDTRALLEHLPAAPVLLAQPDFVAAHLQHARQLRWLQSTWAGVEPLVARGMRADYQLTGVKGLFGPLISEYVFGGLLALTRHFPDYRRQQSHRQWQPIAYQGLAGRTLVIVGLGSIGSHLARTARAFGMQVLGVNRSGAARSEEAAVDAVYGVEQMAAALARADVVVLTLPATPATRGLADAAFFNALKPGAVLINVGRGALVDEPALLAALDAGQVSHAMLDVFNQEPLPAAHGFWARADITVTPHVAAVTFADDIAGIFVDNYQRWQRGEALQYGVDFARGY